MRKLYFKQMVNCGEEKKLEERINKIVDLLNIDGVQCKCSLLTENIYEFIVEKNTRKVTWKDIMEKVNSVRPVKYDFLSTEWL